MHGHLNVRIVLKSVNFSGFFNQICAAVLYVSVRLSSLRNMCPMGKYFKNILQAAIACLQVSVPYGWKQHGGSHAHIQFGCDLSLLKWTVPILCVILSFRHKVDVSSVILGYLSNEERWVLTDVSGRPICPVLIYGTRLVAPKCRHVSTNTRWVITQKSTVLGTGA